MLMAKQRETRYFLNIGVGKLQSPQRLTFAILQEKKKKQLFRSIFKDVYAELGSN